MVDAVVARARSGSALATGTTAGTDDGRRKSARWQM